MHVKKTASCIIANPLRTVIKPRLGVFMTIGRPFNPTSNQVIYHYCAPGTFLSILKSKSIRFSDIFGLNDHQEFHWGYRKFLNLCENMREHLGDEFINIIRSLFQESSNNMKPFIASFSKDGDVLSQWRAYAKDGTGFSLGFDAKKLAKLPKVRILEVLYDEEAQDAEIKDFLIEVHDFWSKEGGFKDKDFLLHIVISFMNIIAYKNPAFAEEKEVRLIYPLTRRREGDFAKIHAFYGGNFGSPSNKHVFNTYETNGIIRACIDVSFFKANDNSVLKHVFLGPRNRNDIVFIEMIFEMYDLKVSFSDYSGASYR